MSKVQEVTLSGMVTLASLRTEPTLTFLDEVFGTFFGRGYNAFESNRAGNYVRLLKIAENINDQTASSEYLSKLKLSDIEKRQLLYVAVFNDLSNAIKVISANKDFDIELRTQSHKTPLHYAAQKGNKDAIKALTQAGADVNAQDNDRKNPLHYAAMSGNKDVLLALLNSMSKESKEKALNSSDSKNLTPLHYAVINSDTNAIAALIDAGADVNAKDSQKITPLHYAAQSGNKEAIKFVLEQFQDQKEAVNAKSKEDLTPLHYVAQKGNKEAIKALIDAGADVNAKDKYGRSPLYYASPRSDKDAIAVRQLLYENGAHAYSALGVGIAQDVKTLALRARRGASLAMKSVAKAFSAHKSSNARGGGITL
ncbi:MAG: ankyrin repeat domain-containing protein [Rickettsiaceae bacterium]|nr:ankyrin repeat domain-containing protein [Rickettsiaceae bacterium]